MTDRMRQEVKVSCEVLVLSKDAEATIRDALMFRQGSTVLRMGRTGKTERWVLLSPRGEARDYFAVTDRDFLSNTETWQRRQAWEAAFVSSHQ